MISCLFFLHSMLMPALVSDSYAGNLPLNTAIFAGHYQDTLFLHLKSFFVMSIYQEQK